MDEQELKEAKRKNLFIFSSITLATLTIGFLYLEVYDPYDVPNFLRVMLAVYWTYSVVALYVSRFASDTMVSKICLNVFRD
jgi:hypothetical protein